MIGLAAENLDVLLFAGAVLLLMAGFPVAFTLAGTALLFALLGWALGVFDLSFLKLLPQRIYGTMVNEVLIAVPLFVFMGVMLERSRVAEDLLSTMGELFGRLPGGLGISVIAVGALLAASTGIVGATVVTLGLLALPTMLKNGYDPALATGSIAASGTLGQIIPPSIVLILLGDVISNSYQDAQLAQGIFSPETVSVGDLFAGALVPGLLLVLIYTGYVFERAVLRPVSAPPVRAAKGAGALAPRVVKAFLPPVLLIVAVLGSILAGVATATEAAAVGAVGALLLAGLRSAEQPLPFVRPLILTGAAALGGLVVLTSFADLRLGRAEVSTFDTIAIWLGFTLSALTAAGLVAGIVQTATRGVMREVVRKTAEITAMVFVILIGAAVFSLVFRGFGGDETVEALLTGLPGGVFGAMLIVMAVMFVLGFFLDFIEITFVVVPLVAPVLLQMGLDPVWLGVMMAMNLQTSFLTPPFGFALFYLRGVAPDNVKTTAIYRGALPFVAIQLLMLALIAALPGLATWLPAQLAG